MTQFCRGDNIGPMRRDAHRLALIDVDDETRFAVLELRAQERRIATRTESYRDEANHMVVRQLLVDDQVVVISGAQQILIGDRIMEVPGQDDARSKDQDGHPEVPAAYSGRWSNNIQMIQRRRGQETWPEFEQCIALLAAFDEQDNLEANTANANQHGSRTPRL